MVKRLSAVFCSLLLLPALTSAAFAQTLTADQIVEKHLTALGGREALSKLTSRKATGTISISTPMGELSGPLELMAKAPNKVRADMRIDLTAVGGPGEMVMSQIFDGTNGWTLNSMQGDSPMEGDQLEGARNNFFPSPLLKYKEMGMTLAVQPGEQVNGRDAHVLLVTPKTGPVEKMFFDTESFLLVRSSSTMTSPELGATEQVSDSSDYRTVDGVKVAFLLLQSAAGQNITLKFATMEHNVELDDASFVKR